MSSQGWSGTASAYKGDAASLIRHFSTVACGLLLTEESCREDNLVILDVAAGPATFTMEAIEFLGREKSKKTRFIVTDFAPGMVEAARNIITKDAADITNVEFHVSDAQELSQIADHSCTHIACMFGVMFPPSRHACYQAIKRCLIPGVGRAVISTWFEPGFGMMINRFAKHIGTIEDEETSSLAAVANVGKDADALKKELEEAGYVTVSMFVESCAFDLPFSDDMFMGMLSNPVMGGVLKGKGKDTSELLTLWNEYLRLPINAECVDLERKVIKVVHVANIAVVTV